MRFIVCFIAVLFFACGASDDSGVETSPPPVESREEVAPEVNEEEPATPLEAEIEPEPESNSENDIPEADCDDPVPVFENGTEVRRACPNQYFALGLTEVDLSDDWVPYLFAEDPSLGEAGEVPYHDTFVALADEREDDVPEGQDHERFLELFGIFPTFRVMLERLSDDERHACHDRVDSAGLEALDYDLLIWGTEVEEQEDNRRTLAYLRHRLSRAVEELGLESVEDLADDERWSRHYRQMRRLAPRIDATIAAQEHLRCDGLATRYMEPGVFDWRTAGPLKEYQRAHMVVSGGHLDAATRRALLEDSRTQDFHGVLRVLRERIVDATGVIEDGSAARSWGEVLGVNLDAEEFQFEAGHGPAENAAADWISPATQVAAEALGWTNPEVTEDSLRSLREEGVERVAIALPPVPEYHSEHMTLRAEIHRGDVYYRFPYASDGRRLPKPIEQRPVLTLYAEHDGQEIALVRWPSTIGDWKAEQRSGGGTGLRYKESFVGERLWRDIIAAPAWLPPRSAPDEVLIRRDRGRIVPNYSLFGPGYRSAFGLVMIIHHKLLEPEDPSADPESEEAQPRFYDQGIRTHGSVGYRSMTRGTSHGCHRLFNHLAIRMSSFLLRHREHTRHGSIRIRYHRRVRGHRFSITSRGYRYELTPPVEVNVLEGNIRGGVDEPITSFRPLREDLVAREAADDTE